MLTKPKVGLIMAGLVNTELNYIKQMYGCAPKSLTSLLSITYCIPVFPCDAYCRNNYCNYNYTHCKCTLANVLSQCTLLYNIRTVETHEDCNNIFY